MSKKKFVISKTPLRISFVGGGTDFKDFYKKNNGEVISAAIDKYVYVTIKSHNETYKERYRLNYSDTENKKNISSIDNKIIKECLKFTGIKEKLYISIISDFPAGSGMGGSSSTVVGLLNALFEFQDKKVSKKKLLKFAYDIEINKMKSPIGKQDHVPAVYGGFNHIYFSKKGEVSLTKLNLSKKIFNNIFKKSLLIWTENSRSANKILKDQKKKMKRNDSFLLEMKDITNKSFKILNQKKNTNINSFLKLILYSWSLKKKLTLKIMNKKIKKIEKVIKNNKFVISYKLLGAGGGGFYLVFFKNKDLRIRGYKSFKYSLDKIGSTIIHSS